MGSSGPVVYFSTTDPKVVCWNPGRGDIGIHDFSYAQSFRKYWLYPGTNHRK